MSMTLALPALKAPFPYFGGKTRAAPLIWQALGDCRNFVEPFMGSLAVLLARPHAAHLETVNDADGFLVNVWRALREAPAEVAHWCDRPVTEADQTAIHCWLVGQRDAFTARLFGDPDYFDAQIAGRWLYGICCWIGSGWCSGQGPWHSVNGQLVDTRRDGAGVSRQLLRLGNAGEGVHRKRPHLGNAGQGVHRQLVHLGQGGGGQGIHALHAQGDGLLSWFAALSARLRRVRICCGDWSRVCGPSVTWKHGLTGVLLDPPYSAEEARTSDLYRIESETVAHDVRAWCLANGPKLRVVLCGYGTVHDALLDAGWTKTAWQANGGFGNQGQGQGRANAAREQLWCSPHCLPITP
jgi:site-specific DNA-adenine methylase